MIRAKTSKDADHKKTTELFGILPTFILGPLMTMMTYVGQNMGISFPPLGLRANAMGHLVITNIGTLNIEQGFAPIPTPMRCQMIACVGRVEKRTKVIDDKIEIRDMMTVVYTYDHRFGDAANGLRFLKLIHDYVEDPENFNLDKYKASKKT